LNYTVEILILPKDSIRDPEGEAIERHMLGEVRGKLKQVRVGKVIRVILEASSKEEAIKMAEEFSSRGLHNPLVHKVELRAI
jgi:phosphoribosylformylglycinamidine synthase PurS subunit